MSDFYVTLPSYASKAEFKKNAANKFTVRLPQMLRFPQPGWKVGLSSISLPDARIHVTSLVPAEQYLVSTYWGVKRGPQGKRVVISGTGTVTMNDMDKLDSVVNGETLMHAIFGRIEARRISETQPGDHYQFLNKKHLYVKHEWVSNGPEHDLFIQNENIALNGANSFPKLLINIKLAIKMGWLTPIEIVGNRLPSYVLGPNLLQEFIGDKPPDILGDKKLWDVIDLVDPTTHVYWTAYGNILRLSLACNWRFINLNNAYSSIVGSPNRTLHVYSNVAGSGILGDQVTDLFREIQYTRRGQGTSYFEPLHVQYLPLRVQVIETVETAISEINGDLVSFGEGQSTLVTLHFKQEV